MRTLVPFVNELVSIQPEGGFSAFVLADVLERLHWCLPRHECKLLMDEIGQWVAGSDFRKAAVAVGFQEICPVRDGASGILTLEAAENRWSELGPDCQRWISFLRSLPQQP